MLSAEVTVHISLAAALMDIAYTAAASKGKSVPLQAWSGPEGSRKLRFPDFMTTAQGGCKVVSLTHRPHLPPGNPPGTHFCYRLSRPQGHSVIMSTVKIYNNNNNNNNNNKGELAC